MTRTATPSLEAVVRALQPFLQVTGRCSEDVGRQALAAVRVPDKNMVLDVAWTTGVKPSDITAAWIGMIDAIVAKDPK